MLSLFQHVATHGWKHSQVIREARLWPMNLAVWKVQTNVLVFSSESRVGCVLALVFQRTLTCWHFQKPSSLKLLFIFLSPISRNDSKTPWTFSRVSPGQVEVSQFDMSDRNTFPSHWNNNLPPGFVNSFSISPNNKTWLSKSRTDDFDGDSAFIQKIQTEILSALSLGSSLTSSYDAVRLPFSSLSVALRILIAMYESIDKAQAVTFQFLQRKMWQIVAKIISNYETSTSRCLTGRGETMVNVCIYFRNVHH